MFVKVVRNIVMMWSHQLFLSENGDQILSPFFWKYTSERHKNNVFSDVYIKSHFVDGKSSSLCNWARAHRKELKTCDAQRITIILIHTPSSSWGWRRKSESVTWSSEVQIEYGPPRVLLSESFLGHRKCPTPCVQ
jgi:hypothetical protein